MAVKKSTRLIYILLSLFFAILLWVYVGDTVNPDTIDTLRNIPVVYNGIDALEDRGLMITEGADQTVNASLQAKRAVFSELTSENVSVTINVGDITEVGVKTVSSYSLTFPRTVSSEPITVRSRSPETITYTVVKRATREIEVRGNFNGSVADGYQKGEFTFSPKFITVSGPEDVVNSIDCALVTLSQEDLAETYAAQTPFTLVDQNGDGVDTTYLEMDADTVYTTLQVGIIKEVPLTVNLISGGGATEEDVVVTIEPETIVVSGEEDDVEALSSISLGDIDLAKVIGTDTQTKRIELSSELTNVSGISEATVTVSIDGLTTRILDVDNITFINIPTGYSASSVTQTLSVSIRGKAETVEQIVPSQLRIVADLTGMEGTTGNQTVPVKIYLDGTSDVGVVGDYTIVVTISR